MDCSIHNDDDDGSKAIFMIELSVSEVGLFNAVEQHCVLAF